MDTPANGAAVFLDRDGVLNRKAPEGDYVKSPKELDLLPGAAEAVARLNRSGLPVVVVTNQRGVARGLMSAEDLTAVHSTLERRLVSAGARLDRIMSCTHGSEESCGCRKPRPGLLLQAAAELRLDLERSWMVGDRGSDILAGREAGCHTILVGPLTSPGGEAADLADDLADDLTGAVDIILAHRSNEAGPAR